MIRFVVPDYYMRQDYAEMMDEWFAEDEQASPWPLAEQYRTDEEFEKMIRLVNDSSLGSRSGEYAPSKTYWVKDEHSGRLIGAVNIRLYLTKQGFDTWGHIGYGVRPSQRSKGYGVKILQQALEECRRMNMEKVLLCCSRDNVGSARVIEKCGGIFESCVYREYNGGYFYINRYWIEL